MNPSRLSRFSLRADTNVWSRAGLSDVGRSEAADF